MVSWGAPSPGCAPRKGFMRENRGYFLGRVVTVPSEESPVTLDEETSHKFANPEPPLETSSVGSLAWWELSTLEEP